MIFIDPIFLFLFLPTTLLLFYTAAYIWGRNSSLLILFVSSIIFYIPYGISSAILLFVALLVNFSIASALLQLDDYSRHRAKIYAIGQFYNISSLLYFKYKIVSFLLGTDDWSATDVAAAAIPAGISFYTFHQAAFLADAYAREKSVVEFFEGTRSLRAGFWAFCRYGAFVSFFPQLIIGPITYFHEFHPQVKSKKFLKFDPVNIAVGLAFISIGMFKKVVIADNIAPTVDIVFGAAEVGAVMGPAHAWIGALSYMAQLYFDFSGYSDMALGSCAHVWFALPDQFLFAIQSGRHHRLLPAVAYDIDARDRPLSLYAAVYCGDPLQRPAPAFSPAGADPQPMAADHHQFPDHQPLAWRNLDLRGLWHHARLLVCRRSADPRQQEIQEHSQDSIAVRPAIG